MIEYGIAFSGGGTRGAAHVGVLKALEENKLLPTSVSGTSAGSIIAGLYAAGFTPGQLEALVLELSNSGVSLLDPDIWGFIKSILAFITRTPCKFPGLFKGKKLENFLCSLSKRTRLEDVPMKLVIPAVDLNSGATITFSNANPINIPPGNIQWKKDALLCTAIRASCGVPIIFHPVMMNSMMLVDGGVTDILPVDLLSATGVSKILAVDISEDYSAPAECNLIEIGAHSFSLMSDRLRNYVSHSERYRLKLELPEKSGLLTFSYMEECMRIGYEATIKELSAIRAAFY